MNINNMKNIVVLKDLPSNIVEEAIVILKANVDLKKHKIADNKKENIKVGAKLKNNSKDYIVKEAEMIVSNYISSIEKPKQLEITNKKLIKQYKNLKKLSILFATVGFLGILVNLI